MPLFQINRKLLALKLQYFIGIGGYAPFSPFLTTISRQRGYSAFIVGLMFMLHPIPALFISPIIVALTDKYKCRRFVYISSTILIFLLVLLMGLIPGKTSREEFSDLDVVKSPLFWLFFSTIALMNVSSSVKSVLDNAICMHLLGEEKDKYGKQRLWGSVGWSLFAMFAGASVDWYSKGQEFKNYDISFAISLLCFLVDIYLVIKIKVVQKDNNNAVVSDVKKLLTQGKVLAFLLWVVFFGFFMSFIWNFVFWYLEDLSKNFHPETLSWIKTLQGLALIVQCFGGEVPSFFLSGYVLKNVDHMNMFSLMFFTFAVIFSAYSFIENPLLTLPIEVLNGMVFALMYSVAISYAARLSPVGAEGTLQGFVGTAAYGIGSPLGSLIGGYMFKNIGSINSFKILGVVAFVTCVTQIVVNRLINRPSRSGEDIKDTVYSQVETKENPEEILAEM